MCSVEGSDSFHAFICKCWPYDNEWDRLEEMLNEMRPFFRLITRFQVDEKVPEYPGHVVTGPRDPSVTFTRWIICHFADKRTCLKIHVQVICDYEPMKCCFKSIKWVNDRNDVLLSFYVTCDHCGRGLVYYKDRRLYEFVTGYLFLLCENCRQCSTCARVFKRTARGWCRNHREIFMFLRKHLGRDVATRIMRLLQH